jgi:hypothetical protein
MERRDQPKECLSNGKTARKREHLYINLIVVSLGRALVVRSDQSLHAGKRKPDTQDSARYRAIRFLSAVVATGRSICAYGNPDRFSFALALARQQ